MKSGRYTPFYFLAPALALVFAFRIYPLIYGLYLSFVDYYIPDSASLYKDRKSVV